MSSKVETSVAQGLPEWQTAMQGGRLHPQSASTGALSPNQNKRCCWFSKSKQKNPCCNIHVRWCWKYGMLLHFDVDVPFGHWRVAAVIMFQQRIKTTMLAVSKLLAPNHQPQRITPWEDCPTAPRLCQLLGSPGGNRATRRDETQAKLYLITKVPEFSSVSSQASWMTGLPGVSWQLRRSTIN